MSASDKILLLFSLCKRERGREEKEGGGKGEGREGERGGKGEGRGEGKEGERRRNGREGERERKKEREGDLPHSFLKISLLSCPGVMTLIQAQDRVLTAYSGHGCLRDYIPCK